jgi:glycolate oxidase
MIWVREAWDPFYLANPGKIFPSPRTCGEAAHAHHYTQELGIEAF